MIFSSPPRCHPLILIEICTWSVCMRCTQSLHIVCREHPHKHEMIPLRKNISESSHFTIERTFFSVMIIAVQMTSVQLQMSFYYCQISLHAVKATGWIQTLSLNLSSLHEACTLPGELFISFIKCHILVIQPSSGNVPSGMMFSRYDVYHVHHCLEC